MTSGLNLERVWEAEDVSAELKSALEVVAELEPPDDLRLAVFQLAAQALMQRAQVQHVGRAHVPSMAVSLPRGGH